jgi:hypothetical protein
MHVDNHACVAGIIAEARDWVRACENEQGEIVLNPDHAMRMRNLLDLFDLNGADIPNVRNSIRVCSDANGFADVVINVGYDGAVETVIESARCETREARGCEHGTREQ